MSAKPDPKKILDEALQLEPNARVLVAETLLESLDLDVITAYPPDPAHWQADFKTRK